MQTEFNEAPSAFTEGQIYDGFTSSHGDVISRALEAASGANAGVILCAGTNKELQAKPPASGGDLTDPNMLGGLLFQPMQSMAVEGTTQFADKSSVAIVRRGRFVVRAEDAVTARANAFVRFAAGAGGTRLGAVRSNADTATAASVANIVFVTGTTGANQLCVVEIR